MKMNDRQLKFLLSSQILRMFYHFRDIARQEDAWVLRTRCSRMLVPDKTKPGKSLQPSHVINKILSQTKQISINVCNKTLASANPGLFLVCQLTLPCQGKAIVFRHYTCAMFARTQPVSTGYHCSESMFPLAITSSLCQDCNLFLYVLFVLETWWNVSQAAGLFHTGSPVNADNTASISKASFNRRRRMNAESRQIPQKLATRLKFAYCILKVS